MSDSASDSDISERKGNVPEVSAVGKLLATAKRKRHAVWITETAQETKSTTPGPAPKRPARSAAEVEMLQTDKMPCGTITCLNKETLFLSYKMRCCTPVGNSCDEGRAVKQAVGGRQDGDVLSEEVLPRLGAATTVYRLSPDLLVEEKKFPSLDKPAECFPPFTEAMEKEISTAFGKGDPGEIMSSAFKLKVTREDIQTLDNLHWLNDEVINFYMTLLVERNKKEGYPAVYAFNTFFYPKLTSGGHAAVRRWTKGMDLFKQDLILVPVHLRSHWTLAVIDMRKKAIKHYDSLGQKKDKICKTLFKYLQEESQEKRNTELIFSEWTFHSMEPHEIPQQLNGSDCGVFLCTYADCVARDRPMTFTQDHMPYLRRKMAWEIIHRHLL